MTHTKDVELPLIIKTSMKHASFASIEMMVDELNTRRSLLVIPYAQSRKGVYYQLFACLCGVAMGAVRKKVSHIPVTQMLFMRTPFVLLIILAYFWKTKQISEVRRGMNRGMFQMATLSALGATLFFSAIVSLPLSDMMTIMSSVAIMNGILGSIFLKEPYLPIERLAGVISFFGVLLIVRPPFLFGEDLTHQQTSQSTQAAMPRYVAAGVAFLAAVVNSGSTIAMRSMKSQNHRFMTPFMINFVIFVVYGLYFIATGSFTPLSLSDYFVIMIFAIFSLSTIYYATMALETESPSTVGIVSHSQLIISIIIDLLAFGTLPTSLTLLGASLVVGSCLFIIFWKK